MGYVFLCWFTNKKFSQSNKFKKMQKLINGGPEQLTMELPDFLYHAALKYHDNDIKHICPG